MNFEDCAELIKLGYLVVPIPPGSKAPLERGWQRLRIHDHLERWRGHGVGFLCGVGKHPLLGLDIDVTDEPLSLALQELAETMLGPALVRVGAAPKALLLYQAAEAGWPKVATAWWALGGAKMRVEALGLGQQFVAYGVHPGTGRPYEWTDMYGGAACMPAAELTRVSREALRAYLEAAEKTAQQHGCEAGPRTHERLNAHMTGGTEGDGGTADPLLAYEPPVGVSIDQAREALRAIDAADADYDTWVTVGMALHHESGGSADWHALWDEWCVDSGKFVQATGDAKWWTFGRRTTGRPVTMRTVLKLAADARGAQRADGGEAAQEGPRRYARTEAGNAQRLVDRWGQDLLWCAETGHWYRWTGAWWRQVPLTEVRQLAKEVVDAMRDDVAEVEGDKDKVELLKWCAASQRWNMYQHMVEIAALDPRLWVRMADLDAHWYLFGVPNGVVDLRTGALLPPDRAHRITRVAAVPYDAGAPCPTWDAQVSEVHGHDPEMIGAFRRIIGYCIMGKPVEDVLVINHGGGNNGKSTTHQPILAALGDHATTTPASLFLQDNPTANAGSARPDLLALAGKRFVLVNEPEAEGVLREGLVKSMTGGENIPARALWSSTIVQLRPTWVVCMSTNHKPVIKGDDKGIWRRLLPVPWDQDFDNSPLKDVNREDKLRAELPGILAWCVRGALEYQRSGLALPGRIDTARREYRGEMDLLADWLAERCECDAAFKCTLDTLWSDWESWARLRGELKYVASRKALSKRLQNRGFSRERSREGVIFWGVKLREFASLSAD